MIQQTGLKQPGEQEVTVRVIDYALKFSLALAIILIPFRPIWGSYAIILLGASALANGIYCRKWEGFTMLSYTLIVIYLVRVIWLSRSPDVSYGARTLETASPLIGIPLIFSFFTLTDERKRFAMRAYILMCAGIMVYAFIQLAIYFQSSPYSFTEYTLFHLDPAWFWESSRYFSFNMLNWDGAHYSFITLILIYGMYLAVYFRDKTAFDKWMAVAYVVLLVVFQVYAGSRIGLLIILISAVAYGVFAIPGFFKNKIVFMSLAIGAALLIMIVMYRWGSKINYDRYLYAKYSFAAIEKYPLLGSGTGAGEFVLNDPGLEKELGWVVNHPHNQFLSDLLEYGILGTLPLIAFICVALMNGFEHQDRALLAVIMAAVIFMLSEAPLNSNKGVVPLVFVTSLLFNKKAISAL